MVMPWLVEVYKHLNTWSVLPLEPFVIIDVDVFFGIIGVK
jgi:hypothetical protein